MRPRALIPLHIVAMLLSAASALRLPVMRARVAPLVMAESELSARERFLQEVESYERAVAEQKAAEAARAAGVGARASQLSYVVGGVAAIAGARAIAVGQRLERERKELEEQQAAGGSSAAVGRRAVLGSVAGAGLLGFALGSTTSGQRAASTTRPQVR